MKRITCLILVILLALTMTACGKPKEEKYAEKAYRLIEKKWNEYYDERSITSNTTINPVYARVITIKENDNSYFKDVVAVVEFDLLTNYYNSAPAYYCDVFYYDTVTFYKDGTSAVYDIFGGYFKATYKNDYSQYIDEIIELGSKYSTEKTDNAISDEENGWISIAIDTVRSTWTDIYGTDPLQNDGTLKIVNTRLSVINEDNTFEHFDEYFTDVKAIVEFDLYTDYFGSAPYYDNRANNNIVWIMNDGTSQMAEYTLNQIYARYYSLNVNDLFSKNINLGDTYNDTFVLMSKNNE